MKAEYINPFVQSVSDVFENMLGCSAQMGSAGVADPSVRRPDILGIIGLSGGARGNVILRFPVTTALRVVSKLINCDLRSVDASVIDGVGELVNIIAGGAKTRLEELRLSLSLPTVARGDVCHLSNMKQVVWLELPFSSPLGDFSVAVHLEPSPVETTEVRHASVVS